MFYDTKGFIVEQIPLFDRTRTLSVIGAQKPATIHIDSLDRKTYITDAGFDAYFWSNVYDSLISVSRDGLIGDITPLTIGDVGARTIFSITRWELE